MEVRRATQDDAGAISALNATVQRLHAEAYPHLFKPPSPETFSPDAVAGLLDDPSHIVFIATVDGVPAGYVYCQIARRPESYIRYALDLLYIHHISVDAAYQGTGVGSALMDAVRDLARAEGITHLELDVWSFNDHARRFFESQGFKVYNLRLWTDIGHP